MKTALLATIFALGLYVVSYVMLSSFGAYAPAAFGPAGVKYYNWAPLGFYDPLAGNWRLGLVFVYAPLDMVDRRFWHTHSHPEASDPQHPGL